MNFTLAARAERRGLGPAPTRRSRPDNQFDHGGDGGEAFYGSPFGVPAAEPAWLARSA